MKRERFNCSLAATAALGVFIAGAIFGSLVQVATAQSDSEGTVGLNHFALSVADIDEAIAYYTETMGFPEAFRIENDAGEIVLVYLQISATTFVELQPANEQRPPGLNHIGLQVEDMEASTAMFKSRGADVGDIRIGGTKSILANISAPGGLRIELLEFPPGSLTANAMENWKKQ